MINSKTRLTIKLLAIIITLISHQSTWAGVLSDFESAAKGEQKTSTASSNSSSRSSSNDDDDSSILADILFGIFFGASDGASDNDSSITISSTSKKTSASSKASTSSSAPRSNSNSQARSHHADSQTFSVDNRTLGSAIIPFLRVDLAGNYIDTGINGISGKDQRLEVGYDAFSLSYHQTQFIEEETNKTTKLRIKQVYAKWRLSIDAAFEVDLGLGQYQIKGEEVNDGLAITAPILFHPSRHFGLELRPSYSTDKVSDVELSVITGWDLIKFKAGLRWINVDGASLDNVFAGVIFVL